MHPLPSRWRRVKDNVMTYIEKKGSLTGKFCLLHVVQSQCSYLRIHVVQSQSTCKKQNLDKSHHYWSARIWPFQTELQFPVNKYPLVLFDAETQKSNMKQKLFSLANVVKEKFLVPCESMKSKLALNPKSVCEASVLKTRYSSFPEENTSSGRPDPHNIIMVRAFSLPPSWMVRES